MTCPALVLSFSYHGCWHVPCELSHAICLPAGKQHLQLFGFKAHPVCRKPRLTRCAHVAVQDEYRDEPGAVIAADFYHSNALMAMDDADIVAKVHRNLVTCEPGFAGAQVSIHPHI